MASLDRHDAAEVVPLEEHVHVAEAGLQQQFAVLQELVGDQDVLQCLALLRDLGFGVPIAPLEVLVVPDEQAVEVRVLAQYLFDEDQPAVLPQALEDVCDQPLPMQGPQELQRQHHQGERGVLHFDAEMQIRALESDLSLDLVFAQL